MTSPPQCGAKMAVMAPPVSHSSSNHNNVTAENSEQKLVNSGGGGEGGGCGEGFERLEIFVDDGERSHDDVLPDWLTDGVCVTVGSNKAGTVRYMGMTQFAEGVWVGVELDTPVGKLDVWMSSVLMLNKFQSFILMLSLIMRLANCDLLECLLIVFSISALQVRMTVQSEAIGISTVNQVTGCWSAQTGCPVVVGLVLGREIPPLRPTSPSCEGKPLLPAGGRTASPGAVETGKLGAVWERLTPWRPLARPLFFSSQLCNRLTLL